MRVTAVTCIRDEGPFLLEWIAHHRTLGVTDFLFYSNDCADGSDAMLDALAAAGVVTHLPNPALGRNYQAEALLAARAHPLVAGADWVWVADVDEFLNIHAGDGTLAALIAACGDPGAISVHWQFFANGGVEAFEDRPVTAQFQHTHNPDIWSNQLQIEVKTLIRQDFPLLQLGAHRPWCDPDTPPALPRWTDGSGRPVPARFAQATLRAPVRGFSARGARRHATLKHYALRALDSYLVKAARGDVARARRRFDLDYWCERNDDALRETSILRHAPRLAAEMARLAALPGVADAHAACCAAHRAQAAALSAGRRARRLRRQLMAAPHLPPAELALMALLE